MKPGFFNLIPFVFSLLVFQGCSPSTSQTSSPSDSKPALKQPQIAKVGFIAPDFQLNNVKGEMVALNSFRGKIVLVNFWATWCGPCRAEMPSMEEIYNGFSRKEFEILAVSTDEDGLRSVVPFLEEYRFTFPVLIDDTLRINDLYGVSSIPTSVIVDRNGIVTNRFFGAVDWTDPKQKKLLTQLIQSPS